MTESKEVSYCKKLFNTKGKKEKLEIIENSSLTNREQKILYNRYIEGLSAKECSDILGIEIESYKKLQRKLLLKLYNYLIITD